MAISSEFEQAVRDRNKLRVRIMLKNSLLIDKTFHLFNEMEGYASKNDVSPWTDAYIPLERAEEKSWNVDTMNYELAALVNDFTKEHVKYVKAIIAKVYGISANRPGRAKKDLHEIILNEANSIYKILKKKEDKNTNTTYTDIDDIGKHAKRIVNACNELNRKRKRRG